MIQLPFYGGAKGSILRFVKNSNGSLSTRISPAGDEPLVNLDEKTSDDVSALPNQFGDNLKKIQTAASKLVAIQQVVKASGKISADEKKSYVENLDTLGQAAQALAQINAATDEDDFRLLITGKWTPIYLMVEH